MGFIFGYHNSYGCEILVTSLGCQITDSRNEKNQTPGRKVPNLSTRFNASLGGAPIKATERGFKPRKLVINDLVVIYQ